MCGLLGRFSWRGPVDADDILPRLLDHLAHRGPDEGAYWSDEAFFLGHRRLSIIDLTHGGQPMASPDGALVVAFNGEIYNYVELRDELARRGYTFRTTSDTEVLLHGYREWGRELPERLTGMFAFAIADRRKRELYLARDRFGEKPLLYVEAASAVTFASELRPLAALPELARRLNEHALASYLCLNYVPGDETLLVGVRRLPPGSWRQYSARGVTAGEYWSPRCVRVVSPAPSAADAQRRLRALLDRSVRMALRSDVPVGIFLSGGMDSSLVAESAVRQGGLSRAYSLDFDEATYSEHENAKFVASRLGLPITRVVLTAKALEDFVSIVEHADDPLADSSSLAVWTLARAAARTNKVVLGGDGGDELFAGYLTYKATLLYQATLARLPMRLRVFARGLATALRTNEGKVSFSYKLMRFLRAVTLPPAEAHFTWNGVWLPSEAAGLLRHPDAREAAHDALRSLAERHGLGDVPDVRDLQRADVRDYLPNDILAKVDRMSMAHGLEVRAPFLEAELAEFALGLPASLKGSALGRPKRILRALAAEVYGPAFARARKQGFSIPVHRWLRGPARALVYDLLSPEAIAAVDALEPTAVARTVEEHMTGRRSHGWELWGLMVLTAWHRARIQNPPRPRAGTGMVERRFPLAAA